MDRLLTTADVAGLLRVDRSYVDRLAREGRLPCHQFGRARRFDPSDVQAYVAATKRGRMVQPVAPSRPAPLEDLADYPAGFEPVAFDTAPGAAEPGQRKAHAGR